MMCPNNYTCGYRTGITVKQWYAKLRRAIRLRRMCIKVKVNYRKATGFWPLSKNGPAIEL